MPEGSGGWVPPSQEDLRVHLGFTADEWTAEDIDRAEDLLVRAHRRIRAMVGGWRVDKAEADGDSDRLAAVDEAILEYVTPLFANPERVMQRRSGADNSVSFADASDAADGRERARSILRDAFGTRAGATTL